MRNSRRCRAGTSRGSRAPASEARSPAPSPCMPSADCGRRSTATPTPGTANVPHRLGACSRAASYQWEGFDMSHSSTTAQLARRLVAYALVASATVVLAPRPVHAQNEPASDSLSRSRRYMHNIGYGAALGFVWAGIDELQDDPDEWSYGQKLAS